MGKDNLLKAKGIAIQINMDNEKTRKLITSLAEQQYIPQEYLKIDNSGNKKGYLFKKSSLTYIKNFIYIYSLIENKKQTYEILIKKNIDIDALFKAKKHFIKCKSDVYKNTLHNLDNLIPVLKDKTIDFTKKILEEDEKLYCIKIQEELQEISNNKNLKQKEKLDLIKSLYEIGDRLTAKKNLRLYIEEYPRDIEGKLIYIKFLYDSMKKSYKKIEHYNNLKECAESPYAERDYEDLIAEEDLKMQNKRQNQYEKYLEIYLFYKNNNSLSSYKIEKEASEYLKRYYIGYYFLSNAGYSLSFYNHMHTQEKNLIDYYNTNILKEEKDLINKDIIIELFSISSDTKYFKFDNKNFIENDIISLYMYFIFDLKKYIEKSTYFFENLIELDLNKINPILLNEYVSFNHKDCNVNDTKNIFQKLFKIYLSKEKFIKFNKNLDEKILIYTNSKIEERKLNLFKRNDFIKLYKDKNNDILLEEFEKSLVKLIENSSMYKKVAYGYIKVILEEIVNKANRNIDIIYLLNKLFTMKIIINSSMNLFEYSWDYNKIMEQGCDISDGEDIIGEYVMEYCNFKSDLKDIINLLEKKLIFSDEFYIILNDLIK